MTDNLEIIPGRKSGSRKSRRVDSAQVAQPDIGPSRQFEQFSKSNPRMLSSITSMNPAHDITLGSLRLGIGNPLFLLAGPCVIENETHARKMAELATGAAVPCLL